MTKKLLVPLFVLLFYSGLNAQVTIFFEDFETASGAENIASPYLGWQNGFFPTNPTTNDNFFWVFDNTRCDVITGTHSMAVSMNTPATTGTLPQYTTNKRAQTFVYNTTAIDATNYTGLALDFNWICEGEAGQDYGYVLYSFDTINWAALPDQYQGQNTVQNVTNLDLSFLDGQIFYLGFGWDNDNNGGASPGFIIDDIDLTGTLVPACTVPNQPTVINLTPTNNSILGTFTAATPISDNYLIVVSTNPTAPTPVNGTSYNIGDVIGTGTVVDIDSDTSFTASGLSTNTTYYIFIYSYNNNACSGGPIYNSATPLSGNATTTNSSYCTPLTVNTASTRYIENVEFLGTLNDVSNLNSGFSTSPNGYQDFTSLTNSTQAQGNGINVYIESNNNNGHWKAWVDWNNDGTFNNDASETVYDSGSLTVTATATFGFVIPVNQPVGDYRIRIRFYDSATATNLFNDFDACEIFDSRPNDATPNPNDTIDEYGEAEDYLFTVVESCAAQITSISEGGTCGPGSAALSVTGNASATDFNWYANETGGTPIATSASFSPVISATTTYWVTATDGSCESLKRIPVTATLNPVTELTLTPATPIICGEDDVIEIAASGSTETAYLIDEDFEAGGTGVFNVVNLISNSPAEDALTEWQNRTSTFVPSQQVWFPAISSGFGSNQFIMATSDIAPSSGFVWTYLESPVIDTSNFTDLTLNFDMYFSKYSATSDPDDIDIYISTDGGATYNLLQNIDYDVGIGTNFGNINIDLSAYINEASLQFTIDYVAGWMDGVAIDNVQVFGSRPLNPSFTWTGTVDAYIDAATTIPYVPGTPAASVFIKPDATQLAMSTFTFTANATLSNGCTINKDITITNNTKIWSGAQNTNNWNDPNNWLPIGIPTSDNCVIITDSGSFDPLILGPPTPPVPSYAKNLTILNNGKLEIERSTSLTVTDWINVNTGGTLTVKDDANLVQVTNVSSNNNTGSINVEREVTGLAALDYVYWASPVEGFGANGVSPGTSASFIFEWLPTVSGNGAGNFGNWNATTEIMEPGKGYAIRGLSGTTAADTAEFSGRPSNGIINYPITRGNYNGVDYPGPGNTMATAIDDNWNLVGNPFPSSIYADDFIALNASNITDDSNPSITGTVYLWRHLSAPSNVVNDPFYADYVYNYNPNDYVAYNSTGSTPAGFNGYIASGQAFFVLMDNNAPSPSNLVFDNTMRDGSYTNSQFYRNTAQNENPNLIEKNRIWLDLIDNNNNQANSILVGYVSNATNEKDRLYDGEQLSGTNTLFYSLIGNETMVIQGRSLPFNEEDTVPLGYEIPSSGNYSIAINSLDGLFQIEDQNIYLEDLYIGIIHDLRSLPYTFSSESGIFNDRFVLRYTNASLGVDDTEFIDGIKVFEESETLKITSANKSILSIEVNDILGRTLFFNKKVNSDSLEIPSLQPSEQTLFLKIKLINGQEKIEKIIY